MGIIRTLAKRVGKRGNTSRWEDTEDRGSKKRQYDEKSHPSSHQIMRPKLGFRDDLGIEFRSKMEANVYRFYKWLELQGGKIKVSYEPRLFTFPLDSDNRFGIRGYIPDLEITSDEGIWFIEVKGQMDDTSREKARLFSKNYPGLTLYFIFPKQYEKIRQNYAHLIKNWE